MRPHIPNFITILNLLTGVTGIWFVLESNPYTGALLVFLAAIFDFLDGMSARLLKAYSNVGKSMDSLADVVSFGVLPGIMVFKLLSISLGTGADFQWGNNFTVAEKIMLLTPLIIPAFSALRLARFDNDERQTTEFRGLPTPANALFIAAWLVSYPALHQKVAWLYNPWFIAAISILLAVLLITDIRMFSLKFKSFNIKPNLIRYIFLIVSVLVILVFKIPGVLPVIILYILISLVLNLVGEKNEKSNN
jgi:CDP-diacylglycerol---serine O-phosphatidyltransferase